ncbi:GrpB family protein [Nocardioides sp. SYSU DS0651]|uniref:GrpB family protein n=1 Tax=Nocardioides sp. SYSU DS0651 TaxID=3415955 RepID=UPI003F4B236F
MAVHPLWNPYRIPSPEEIDAARVDDAARAPEHIWEQHRVLRATEPRVNLHVWSPGAREPQRHRMFRDWLRTHPDDRDRYSEVKRQVATRGFTDAMSYNNAKAWFVYDVYEKVFAHDPDHRHDPRPRVAG